MIIAGVLVGAGSSTAMCSAGALGIELIESNAHCEGVSRLRSGFWLRNKRLVARHLRIAGNCRRAVSHTLSFILGYRHTIDHGPRPLR